MSTLNSMLTQGTGWHDICHPISDGHHQGCTRTGKYFDLPADDEETFRLLSLDPERPALLATTSAVVEGRGSLSHTRDMVRLIAEAGLRLLPALTDLRLLSYIDVSRKYRNVETAYLAIPFDRRLLAQGVGLCRWSPARSTSRILARMDAALGTSLLREYAEKLNLPATTIMEAIAQAPVHLAKKYHTPAEILEAAPAGVVYAFHLACRLADVEVRARVDRTTLYEDVQLFFDGRRREKGEGSAMSRIELAKMAVLDTAYGTPLNIPAEVLFQNFPHRPLHTLLKFWRDKFKTSQRYEPSERPRNNNKRQKRSHFDPSTHLPMAPTGKRRWAFQMVESPAQATGREDGKPAIEVEIVFQWPEILPVDPGGVSAARRASQEHRYREIEEELAEKLGVDPEP